jgi:tetratricopeptide (TPR) repeat protein
MSRMIIACVLCFLMPSSLHGDRARKETTFPQAAEGSPSGGSPEIEEGDPVNMLREIEEGEPVNMLAFPDAAALSRLSESEAVARCQRLRGFSSPTGGADDRLGFTTAGAAQYRAQGQLCLALLHLGSTLPFVYSSASCESPARRAALASLRALALKPDYAEAYITLAEAYMIAQRWDDAALAAQNAAALRPNWPSPQCHLALAYLQLGRYADCLAALDEEERIRTASSLQEHTVFDGVVFSHLDEDDGIRRASAKSALSLR